MEKVCPVVFRRGGPARVLYFRHPLAGLQLVKGTVEEGEDVLHAARRELREESGLDLAPLEVLGTWHSGYQGQRWTFVRMEDADGDGWVHRCADDGGHDFAFGWQALHGEMCDGWHALFVGALDWLRRCFPLGRRVRVLGTSGAGKTTTGKKLATRLGLPFVELDAIHWGPEWTPRAAHLRDELARLAVESWVMDGSYMSITGAVLQPHVDTVVWLDLPFHEVMAGVVGRTVRRVFMREELWSGNRERLWTQLGRDSIVWWAATTYHRRRRELEALTEQAPFRVVRLRRRAEIDPWLETVARSNV
jgi:adenylate kinase family enzyme/8-oxo-dGTP pyrophosphatase MutT (NUDIX family)